VPQIWTGLLPHRRGTHFVPRSGNLSALNKALTLTADYQLITDPAYNADRGRSACSLGGFMVGSEA